MRRVNQVQMWAMGLALLCAGQAQAFCGFFVSGAEAGLYNDASQVVLMRKGQRTVMSMSNTYKGPLEDFAVVVPVPVVLQEEQVNTLKANVFERVDKLSAPRLVEYWEQDPCYVPPDPEPMVAAFGARPQMVPRPAPPSEGASLGVTVEAQFDVGEYQIVILSAKEAQGLETWLNLNKYKIPEGASEALAPYIRSGMKFFVAKVNIKKVKKNDAGVVVLSPLRFDFESEELRLPVRLGLLNAQGKQDLIVYVLHPKSRFEVANYPNVFIPSNLEVLDEVRKSFGTFYAQLFDATLAAHGNKAVITEYAWQTSSCDPCPVPPLTKSDMWTLGGDVLIGGTRRAGGGGSGPAGAIGPGPGGPVFTSNFSSWVLTRLHTRYSKDTLSEDLVFAEASPVTGGRARFDTTGVEKPGGVEKANVNNFQGRYIIRHYWEGKVACESPQYGRWGGPPGGGSKGKTSAATDLAHAPREGLKLDKVVRSALPQLKIKGMPAPKR